MQAEGLDHIDLISHMFNGVKPVGFCAFIASCRMGVKYSIKTHVMSPSVSAIRRLNKVTKLCTVLFGLICQKLVLLISFSILICIFYNFKIVK